MKRIAQIRAREIMHADPVKLTPSTPIEAAIQLLEELEIGGVPVVDSSGRPIGILSKSDVARIEHVRSGKLVASRGDFDLVETAGESGEDDANEDLILGMEDYSPSLRGAETVADWMNPQVVSVRPEATLKELCRTMVRERIHRVIVAEHGSIRGIVTSFDVVRCVAEMG